MRRFQTDKLTDRLHDQVHLIVTDENFSSGTKILNAENRNPWNLVKRERSGAHLIPEGFAKKVPNHQGRRARQVQLAGQYYTTRPQAKCKSPAEELLNQQVHSSDKVGPTLSLLVVLIWRLAQILEQKLPNFYLSSVYANQRLTNSSSGVWSYSFTRD